MLFVKTEVKPLKELGVFTGLAFAKFCPPEVHMPRVLGISKP